MSALFRPAALAAKQTSWLGEIVLIRPLSFTFLTAFAAVFAAIVVLFLCWGGYTKRSTVTGQLVPDAGLVKVYTQQPGVVLEKRYVSFETVQRPAEMPGQRSNVLQWPYREGLRIDEAMHPLTILAVGLYGELLPNQNGAPLRLVVPWKYGFKSIKSIVRIQLTEKQPDTSWNLSAPSEYGFYSNVNPAVDHPRWSQARERRIGEFLKRDTLPFNGYAEQVAGLYRGMDLRKNF